MSTLVELARRYHDTVDVANAPSATEADTELFAGQSWELVERIAALPARDAAELAAKVTVLGREADRCEPGLLWRSIMQDAETFWPTGHKDRAITEHEILLRQVAGLFHATGNGMPWLRETVLQHGKYKCLSAVPETELRAILAAAT